MKSAKIHENEILRIEKLNEYEILDTEAEVAFDELTQLASEICGTPISLISLVDPDRQWFKSKVGLDADETSRDIAFCSHAILQDEIFEVPDTLKDDRFHDNPLVEGHPNIRFYAGFPLKSPEGLPIGTLCVIDEKPKSLAPHQRRALEIISNQVISQLELRLKTRKLERANQFKTDFLSNMSHEIRTPLNAIIGFSDVLLNNKSDFFKTEEAISFVKNVDFSGKHLLNMINTVLDLSKIEAGQMSLFPERFDIQEQLQSIVEMLNVKAIEQGIKLQLSCETDSDLSVYLDPAKITQIVINIINNSIKFSDPDTTIDIKASINQERLNLAISDQGIGIEADQLPKIFNKYHQVGNKKVHGTGLGLSITKALVDIMDGEIVVDSVINKGTEVTISLPLNIAKEAQPTRIEKLAELEIPKSIRLLVVEDNQINQTLIRALLKNLDIDADIVANGEASVFSVQKNKSEYDLILMDINLPGIDGFEASRQIKAINPDLKIAALSADIFSDHRDEGLFEMRLAKPITLDALKKALIKMLGR